LLDICNSNYPEGAGIRWRYPKPDILKTSLRVKCLLQVWSSFIFTAGVINFQSQQRARKCTSWTLIFSFANSVGTRKCGLICLPRITNRGRVIRCCICTTRSLFLLELPPKAVPDRWNGRWMKLLLHPPDLASSWLSVMP